MSDQVQAIVAAFSSPEGAQEIMDDLKQGRKAGLIGIIDAAVVVKDADGKLKITDAKRRGRRNRRIVTGGVVGGLLGLLAGPVGLVAVGGGAIGALAGRMANAPMRHTMQGIGESLPPNSSAIVAVIEHTWINDLQEMMIAEGAQVLRSAIAADIAQTLQEGGNVLYTVGEGPDGIGAARVAETPGGASVSGFVADAEGVSILEAQFIDVDSDDDDDAEAEVGDETKKSE
jgi:uncharacterized membrane protein